MLGFLPRIVFSVNLPSPLSGTHHLCSIHVTIITFGDLLLLKSLVSHWCPGCLCPDIVEAVVLSSRNPRVPDLPGVDTRGSPPGRDDPAT